MSLFLLLINIISDINECKEGTHNCSSNAVCNNTKGSYNCRCKPGYEGDGNICTGNFFLIGHFIAIVLHSRPYYLKILNGKFINRLGMPCIFDVLSLKMAGIRNFQNIVDISSSYFSTSLALISLMNNIHNLSLSQN